MSFYVYMLIVGFLTDLIGPCKILFTSFYLGWTGVGHAVFIIFYKALWNDISLATQCNEVGREMIS